MIVSTRSASTITTRPSFVEVAAQHAAGVRSRLPRNEGGAVRVAGILVAEGGVDEGSKGGILGGRGHGFEVSPPAPLDASLRSPLMSTIERIRARFVGVSSEEIEREAVKAVREVRSHGDDRQVRATEAAH